MGNKKFWSFKNKDADTGELLLYGEVSESSWWGDEVTPKEFKKELDALGDVKTLNIYINSPGGDVFAGQAIHSMLKRHSATKNVYIDGLAASIASVIAMAGDKVIMPKNAMMLIHHVSSTGRGTAENFRKLADEIDNVEQSLYAVYEEKTGLTQEEILPMLDAETWMTAEEAVEKGFADEIEESKKLAACVEGGFLMLNSQKFDLSRFKNIPKIEEYEPQEDNPADNGGESQPVQIERQKIQFQQTKNKILQIYGGNNQ